MRITDFLLFLGFSGISSMFLPLLLLVKIKEVKMIRDKLLFVFATIAGISYCLCMMAIFLHLKGIAFMWDTVWLATLALTFFVVIPVYFFTGIRRPEAKFNTIIISILMIAFVGIQFTLTSLRKHPPDKSPVTNRQPSENTHQVKDTAQWLPESKRLVAERLY